MTADTAVAALVAKPTTNAMAATTLNGLLCPLRTLFLLLLSSATLTQAKPYSFHTDIVQKSQQQKKEQSVREELLAKSRPLAEYESNKLDANGNRFRLSEQRLSRFMQEEDDFYVDYEDMYSFSGYSMKYAACQPVQYFSEDAIMAGMQSPMITEDIIILRLCPRSSCSNSAQYGCHYNYAEYAISLQDYLAIMLKYSAKKLDALCPYCAACGVVYQGTASAGDDAVQGDDAAAEQEVDEDAENRRRLDDAAADGYEQAQEEQADEEQVEEADGESYDCTYVDTYCADYDSVCGDPEAAEEDKQYMTYEDYLEYLECTEAKYNDYAYFVRPRCDGYTSSIKMAVYYDGYCVQYAGKEVTVKELGLGFRESMFAEYYNGTCIDCSESDDAPYYKLNSALCNKLHSGSATCTSNLLYDLTESNSDDSTECSFIESIRFGTYDEEGKLTSATKEIDWDTEISTGQKVMLGISMGFCIIFVIYSCYLHHAMTNLLIKSLSHRELLPPSRHQTRRTRSSSRHRREDSEEDWKKGDMA